MRRIRIKELYLKVKENSDYIFIDFFYVNRSRKRLYIKDEDENKNNSNNEVENKGEDEKEDEEEFIEDLVIWEVLGE